jgi:hypothetical protein
MAAPHPNSSARPRPTSRRATPDARPIGWESWRFQQWDDWFGRINGVFLVDLMSLRVVQYPLYSCAPQVVRCDLSALPHRLVPVEEWLAPN